ncbi:thiamine ABC transporter substrate-binding protein [Paludibacterium paludis]|uniref:Thiamine ABC transporter substrate-binding protein n=2 Tax=Paludibacterium paludis TaxID=1225769 RepID=A0A918U8B7_9NEIS|nr:thiamine ABC transporter substrate-binding protein [Paludibacterium paludis]
MTALLLSLSLAQAAELRVITHSSFELPKDLIAGFERQHGARVTIIKAGDAGEMVNKLILTRANPIADVVYGIDNTLIGKARAAGVLDPVQPAMPVVKEALPGAVSTDYGYITLNIDKAWFSAHKKPLPASLEDLARPEWKNLLVIENPATSSTGLGFLLSTIEYMGEDPAFAYWRRLRDNGLKVVKGWSEAYNTEFTRNGGSRPIVLSYASSPAAEVFYSKTALKEAPTGNLLLPGSVFRQIEGAATLKGGREKALAVRFIAFLRSAPVQGAIQTSMWMYPVTEGVTINPVFRFAERPRSHSTPSEERIRKNAPGWVSRFNRTILR